SALLASITKNPLKYSPLKRLEKEDVNPNRHYIIDDSDELYTMVYDDGYKERYQLVLKIMREQNMITDEEYRQAMQEDLREHLKPGKLESQEISSFFVDKVKSDVVEALIKELGKTEDEALDMLYNGGLKIYSTIDMEMQKKLEAAYQNSNNFPNLVARKDSAGNIIGANKKILLYSYNNLVNSNGQLVIPKGDFEYDASGNLILHKNKRLQFDTLYKDGEAKGIRISVKDSYIQNSSKQQMLLKGGPIQVPSEYSRYDANKNVIIQKAFLSTHPEFASTDRAGNLLIGKDYFSISDKGVLQPQSAAVIIDYRTGEIKALIGGREISGRKVYNRALQPRQPGSAIKPLSVYTPAIDNGWTAADVVDDVPHYDHNGRLWPKNSYNGYRGLSTLREAIQHSINVVAVKMVENIGIQTSIDYLKKMGITTIQETGQSNDANLAAMGLGGMTKGISPLELTAAYGSLANGGVYISPKSFTKITDRNGNLILENTSYKARVVGDDVAFIMTDMMRSVITSGTGQRANLGAMPAAGKTGTTSNNYDAWFVGYTPYYVCGVWIGNDVQIQLSSGSGASAGLWKTIMSSVHAGLPVKNFQKPDNVISLAVDTKSGKLPTELSRMDPR
ncbi:MAG TPA: transglycosylase, partial [Clostridiales bacterium]|nr:transglycosylase [Clostridiales bacterium]